MINNKLEDIFYGKVKRKTNKTGNITIDLRSKASRVLSKKSEVMVKITGFSKSSGGVKSNLDYINRNGKVELEDSKGGTYLGKDEVKDFFSNWNDFDREGRRQNQRDTMKLVLSMPEGTDPDKLKSAAREFLKKEFYNHEYVFALHTDDKHPHVHIAVKTLGFDERRLNPRKADIQNWRDGFAETLRNQGIEAEATPRKIRGKVKKSEAQIIRHIEQGDAKREPRKSKVKEAQKQDALIELEAEKKGKRTPNEWDKAIYQQQKEVKAAWEDVASELDKSSPEDQVMAKRIRHFVTYSFKSETQRDSLKKRIKKERDSGIERD